jgi:co-chaperonin GroES (HSP10)
MRGWSQIDYAEGQMYNILTDTTTPVMPIRPVRDRILVEPVVRELSSVLIVENTESLNRGWVRAIGPQVEEAQVGDFIIYGNGTYLTWPVHEIDGVDYQLIQEADVCVIDLQWRERFNGG